MQWQELLPDALKIGSANFCSLIELYCTEAKSSVVKKRAFNKTSGPKKEKRKGHIRPGRL